MPPDEPVPTDEEQRRAAAERAVQANQARNADRLARLEGIADSAETAGDHRDDEELTDEMWEDHELTEEQVNARAMARAATGEGEEAEETEEEQGDRPRNDQREEEADDAAREAGADDVRIVDGVKQYRLLVNGKAQWRTLAEIRATAQKVESADEYLQTATDTVKRATRSAPSAEEAAEADRTRKERLTRRKELLRRVAMGDEQAIDELAELDEAAAPSAVTPDVLRALDERFDSRVTFREAVSWFEGEYAGELKHQAMKSYAGELDAALAAQNPTMPPKTRLKRVGDQIRRELKDTYGLTAGAGGPSEKARRKAEALRRPTPAGERRQEKVDEDEAGDVQSDIQAIARARHQPRAVVHGPVRK
jgi:hypothetical protein